MVLIGICGPAGSGKTTVANIVVKMLDQYCGINAPKLSFATPIKEEAKRRAPEGTKPSRSDLQAIGDEYRAKDKLIVLKMAQASATSESQSGFAVFDDPRLPEEFNWIRGQGFLVYVNTPAETIKERLVKRDGHVLSDEQNVHSTELACKSCHPDHIIDNAEGYMRLEYQIYELLTKLKLTRKSLLKEKEPVA